MVREAVERFAAALRAQGWGETEVAQWRLVQERARFAAACLTDRDGSPWTPYAYQRESLESRALRKVHCDGRDVGKTAEIEIMACWAMVACPGREMLIAAPCENHLFPLMNRLARRFKTTPAFAPSLVEMRRSPSWHFRFSNGFVLWGRIAGPQGVNFQGLHVDWQIVDEAQEMSETGWGELYQALNAGGSRWVYGVPNGLRNTFYRMTQLEDAEQYNWPSSLNPGFDAAKDEELAQLYGGRDSPGYLHRVLGQHGAPAHAVFNLDDYQRCAAQGGEAYVCEVNGDTPFEAPALVPRGDYYLGADLGYARDPSELVVYRSEPPYLACVLRVRLQGVNYARQQAVVDALDAAYGFRAAGLDAGNSGRAVVHQLLAGDGDWQGRLHAFEFGGTLALVLDDGTAVRRRVKAFMTELLERRLAEGTLVLPRDPDREQQYASHTYSLSAQDRIVYNKGNDHIIDADRCAVLAHYLDTHGEDEAPVHLGIGLAAF